MTLLINAWRLCLLFIAPRSTAKK